MITPALILGMLNLLIAFAEGVISLRILLKLMGASTSAPFVGWVYETSKPLLFPFEGMFPSSTLNSVPFTIEFSAIFALFTYMFLAYILQEAIDFISNNFSAFKRRPAKKINRVKEQIEEEEESM